MHIIVGHVHMRGIVVSANDSNMISNPSLFNWCGEEKWKIRSIN